MKKMYTDDSILGEELFIVEGVLQPEQLESVEWEGALESTRSRAFSSKGSIGEIPTRQNGHSSYFSIGTPIVGPLDGLLIDASGETLSPDIKMQMNSYHFYWVRLACSFQAAAGYRFQTARFQVHLNTEPSDLRSPFRCGEQAIAYDMFPAKVEDALKLETKLTVSSEVKFTCNPLDATLALPSYERSSSATIYRSRIQAFDLQGSQPSWMFTPTESSEIEGTHKLYMLVRKPKYTHVRVIFSLEAQVVSRKGGALQSLLMNFRQASDGTLTNTPAYPLC